MLLLGVLLLAGFAQRKMEDVIPAYSKAYDAAFRRLQTVELSDTQTRVTRFGAQGKPFQPQLDELRRRQGEVSDLLVKAVGMKKQALADKKPEGVEEGTRVLVDAEQRAQRLYDDVARLNQKLTAAGAPPAPAGPPREPGARD